MSDEFELVELECPNCHAPLQGRASANVLICQFCGTQVRVVRKHSHSDGAIVVRDASGRPILHTMVPFDWEVNSAILDPNAGGGEWPFLITAELTDGAGSFIRYKSPIEYGCRGARTEQMMATYGNAATAALEPIKRPFPTPAEYYLDEVRAQIGQQLAASSSYVGQLPHPLGKSIQQVEAEFGEPQRAMIMNLARKNGVSVSIDDIYARSICRLFAFPMNGQDYRIAIFATICGNKTTLQMPTMGIMGLGGLLGGLGGSNGGGLLGGLFGGNQQSQQPQYQGYQQQPGFAPPGQQPIPANMSAAMPGIEDDMRANQFRQQSSSQDISWYVQEYYTLIAPADKFDGFYKTVFPEVVGNTKIDGALMQQKDQFLGNAQMNLDASVRDFKARSNAQLQQSLEYSRQMNALSDARMASWQAQSDAHHKAVMDRSHAMFSDSGSAGSSSISDKWSEAILGQNTYVDQYGDEHTVSNRWDEAWRSDSGDIIGTERGVDPGYGWTKLDRK